MSMLERETFTMPVRDRAVLAAMHEALACVAEQPGAASSLVQHPDWLRYELESRQDDTTPYVVVVRDSNDRVLGYAPFLAQQHHAQVALGHRHIPLYRGHALRMLGDGVVALPQNRFNVEVAIAAALRSDRSVRVIRIQEAELPNAFMTQLTSGERRFYSIAANLLEQCKWVILPSTSPAAYLAAMDAKKRSDLTRRQRNVYKKLGEQAILRVFDTPESMSEYGRLMNRVYAKSWHAAASPIDWEALPRHAFFTRLAQTQRVIGHILMLGERPIAYVHGYRLGGRYVLDDTGYDEEFAPLGVGSTLVFQSVQDLLERYPGDMIDFGYGDNQYKRVLANQQTSCGSLYAVRGLPAHARFQLIKPIRWLYRGMRKIHPRTRNAH